MELEQNWQTYRSAVNDKIAIFSINLGLFDKSTSEEDDYHKVLQFSLPYIAEENGLPSTESYQSLLKEILKISALLYTLPDIFFAGYIISAQQANLYFYCKTPEPALETLQQFESIKDIKVQNDRDWDIYFDFLLPSPLEMKINATEEILDMLVQNGRDLENLYQLEHTFHFLQEEDMNQFLDAIAANDNSFIMLRHTNMPISVDDDEDVYIVKVEQELTLHTNEIFKYVEKFELLVNRFSGEYIGWESQDMTLNKTQLN